MNVFRYISTRTDLKPPTEDLYLMTITIRKRHATIESFKQDLHKKLTYFDYPLDILGNVEKAPRTGYHLHAITRWPYPHIPRTSGCYVHLVKINEGSEKRVNRYIEKCKDAII